MKKVLLFAIAFVMLFSLVACKDKENELVGDGAFYSLQEAYDNEFLTKQDLQSIAYYHNDASIPVYPTSLKANIADKIKQNFASHVNCQDTEHNIQIKYYGTYNGSVVAMIDGCGLGYADMPSSENIYGMIFYYANSQRIMVWKEN